MIRRIKLLYSIYNFFHKNKLLHNAIAFNKLGITKRYYSSISSKDFKNADESLLISSANSIQETSLFRDANMENKNSILGFSDNGFLVLKNYFNNEKINAINEEIELLLKQKKVSFNSKNKIMFAINKSSLLRQIVTNESLETFLSALIQGNATLFQSINFLQGSEQKTHSDSIHMTTYPLGGLLGVWIALEDIALDNGPLHYFPGSHKLPYYLNADYNNEGNRFLIGPKDYGEYEKMMAKKILENKMEKEVFLAKKGDVLIWHANLFHGGEPHLNKQKTRKSMVLHYYNINAVCYHEITQRPSLI